MTTANVVFTRYFEQLDTTYETMRRRMVAYYDAVMRFGEKSRVVGERAREVAEVLYFDLKDQITIAVSEQNMEALKSDRDTRNTVVELYLSCAVSSLAIGVGLLCGAFTFPGLLAVVFSPLVEFLLFASLPAYVALRLKKHGDGDGSDRRWMVFLMTLAMSTMAGHLLADKATNLVPAVMFMAPVALALLIDSDFSVNHGLASDRNHFLGLSAAIAFAATGSTALVTGSASFAFVLFTLSHLAWLAVHFQISMSAIMAKNFHQGDFEVLYVVALIVLYTAIALCTSGLNQATPVMPK